MSNLPFSLSSLVKVFSAVENSEIACSIYSITTSTTESEN